jgi:hypothetical protein
MGGLDAIFEDVLIDVVVLDLGVGVPKNDRSYIVDVEGYD